MSSAREPACAPATPISRPETETIPSLAPSTAARNQFNLPARYVASVAPRMIVIFPWWG